MHQQGVRVTVARQTQGLPSTDRDDMHGDVQLTGEYGQNGIVKPRGHRRCGRGQGNKALFRRRRAKGK